jgi:hypothetical protein
MRFGEAPTPEQLLPREYVCTDGKHVRATLSIAKSCETYDALLDTYSYNSRPANGMQLDVRPGTKVLTKPHTELNGAIRVFCCSGIANIDLEERKPPFPDLHAIIGGVEVFLEIAQVRQDGALHAALRDAQSRVLASVFADDDLHRRLRDFSIVFSCTSMPQRSDMDSFANAALEWLRGLRSRPNDGSVLSPPLAPHVVRMSTFPANAEVPVKFALLMNARTPIDYLDDILDRIRRKTEKYYEGRPLWLGLTALDGLTAVMLRLRECNVEVGHFERILVTDTQDVVSFETT